LVQLYINDIPMENQWEQWLWSTNTSPTFLGKLIIPDEAGTNPISISIEVLDRSPLYNNNNSNPQKRNRAFIKRIEFKPTKTNY